MNNNFSHLIKMAHKYLFDSSTNLKQKRSLLVWKGSNIFSSNLFFSLTQTCWQRNYKSRFLATDPKYIHILSTTWFHHLHKLSWYKFIDIGSFRLQFSLYFVFYFILEKSKPSRFNCLPSVKTKTKPLLSGHKLN